MSSRRQHETLGTGQNCMLGIRRSLNGTRSRDDQRRFAIGWATLFPGGPGFQPNSEIDDLEWLSPGPSGAQLTYPRDVQLMRAAVDAPATSPLIILRHTQAIKARAGAGSLIRNRPLAADGKRHAKALIPILAAYGIDELYSSDAVRCVDTLAPYADSRKLSIQLETSVQRRGVRRQEAWLIEVAQ